MSYGPERDGEEGCDHEKKDGGSNAPCRGCVGPLVIPHLGGLMAISLSLPAMPCRAKATAPRGMVIVPPGARRRHFSQKSLGKPSTPRMMRSASYRAASGYAVVLGWAERMGAGWHDQRAQLLRLGALADCGRSDPAYVAYLASVDGERRATAGDRRVEGSCP